MLLLQTSYKVQGKQSRTKTSKTMIYIFNDLFHRRNGILPFRNSYCLVCVLNLQLIVGQVKNNVLHLSLKVFFDRLNQSYSMQG